MKKLISILIFIFAVAIFAPFKVFAVGGFNVFPASIKLRPGQSATFRITATNAAGKLNISSSNPGVASVGASSIFLDNNSETITVVAGSVGSATISVVATSDFATYDEEILAGQTRRISVTVTNPTPPPSNPNPSPKPAPTTTPAPNSQSQTTQPDAESSEPEPVKSNNANASLSIDGYDLEEEEGVYKAVVPHDVSKITLHATPEDEKTTITGDGEIDLKVGKNIIEITATAEDGTIKNYQIEITREASCRECAECQCPPTFLIISSIEGLVIAGFIVHQTTKKNKGNKKNHQTPTTKKQPENTRDDSTTPDSPDITNESKHSHQDKNSFSDSEDIWPEAH